jgi:hypothetical protein
MPSEIFLAGICQLKNEKNLNLLRFQVIKLEIEAE